jgi:hypothetical protein
MEMVLNNGFYELNLDEMDLVDGGRNWVATIAGTICGGATIVGGVAALCVPEPTMATKVGGYSAIVAGVSGIVWAWA